MDIDDNKKYLETKNESMLFTWIYNSEFFCDPWNANIYSVKTGTGESDTVIRETQKASVKWENIWKK